MEGRSYIYYNVAAFMHRCCTRLSDRACVCARACVHVLLLKQIRYHPSCYRNFTRKPKPKAGQDRPRSVYCITFEQLAGEISEQLESTSKVAALSMHDLLLRFVHLLGENGVPDPQYQTHHLKERIRRHFGESVRFLRPIRAKSEIVIKSSLGSGQIATILESTIRTVQEIADHTVSMSVPLPVLRLLLQTLLIFYHCR